MSYRRVSFESRVLVYFACSYISLARLSVVEIRDYSQSNKEIAFVTRDGYLEELLLTELIVPLLLNHAIYVDINFLIFSSSLLLLLSTLASCVETFEAEVIYLCLFTLLCGVFCDIVMAFVSCNIARDKH